jgi:RNA polymerase sigma-70 factor (ECF subfamily)
MLTLADVLEALVGQRLPYEDQLITEALQGNAYAFEVLLRPYRLGMLNMAYQMSGNYEDTKEINQEALLKIFKYLGSYKKGRSFKSWIFKTVINSSYDHLRKTKRYTQIIESQRNKVSYDTQDPEKRVLDKEIQEKIHTCLKALSPKEKSVFLLRDGEGFSVKETAGILGSSSMSVRAHLSRARSKIRFKLEKIYPSEVRGAKSEM